ncbi:MAG: hypothetical protein C0405_12475 [Desulfovibrio sp.]|nr:hypothetical protein [Desulfovibrio sp.]
MPPQSSPAPQAANAVLLHACCGPCSIMSVLGLRERGFAPTLYFHNPNIHPLSEYLLRREGLLAVAARLDAPVIMADALADEDDASAAHPGPWLKAMAALGPGMDDMGQRCPKCYDLRLGPTAVTARRLGFRHFCTSLLYSRYQNRQAILDAGARHARPGLAFLPEDFRPGLLEGVRLSREWGIYRQQYCGCLLSEHERYRRLLDEARGPLAT